MKKFKISFLLLILTSILTPFLQSCLDDNDNYYLAMATFRTTEGHDNYFTLDDGEKMYPQQTTFGKLEDGQRVYIYFDILDENVNGYKYNIKVRGIEKILTKELFVMNEETADSIGDDKINITSIWFGDDYLNIRFQFLGTRNPAELHMINLVRNDMEGADEEEEEGYIGLEFRHNAFDDHQRVILNGIVSFKGPFTKEGMKGLKVRYNSIDDGVKYAKIDFTKESAEQNFSTSSATTTGTSIAY
ncbi:MAG: NigD-like protein [Mediterranea sp.]|jgi:hypothetical protein|nr:NigD-like protein [Mediterranea sp.]